MVDQPTSTDRRKPDRQRKIRGGRRVTDRWWTVPEIAVDLGVSERTVTRKFLGREGGRQILDYYDFCGTLLVKDADFEAFKARHFRPRTPDAA